MANLQILRHNRFVESGFRLLTVAKGCKACRIRVTICNLVCHIAPV